MDGFNPKVQALYPKIEFPVSTGTPSLSHLVEWVHQEQWSEYTFSQLYSLTCTTLFFPSLCAQWRNSAPRFV